MSAKRAAAGEGGSLPPFSNTGGKFTVIDYLSLSCHASGLKVVLETLSEYFECPQSEGGMFGFKMCRKLQVNGAVVGVVAWGGESQKERMMVSLTGLAWANSREACAAIVRVIMAQDETAKISRCDIALDCMDGEYAIEKAVEDYKAGHYNAGGRMPTHRTDGDWLDEAAPLGRTLYIGKGKNGRMIRVYEKGKQLGDKQSPWTRIEIQLRAIDRDIPVEIVSAPDSYFAGACHATAEALAIFQRTPPESIPTKTRQRCADLRRLVSAARNSYGQLFTALVDYYGLKSGTVLEILKREGYPKRIAAMLDEFAEQEAA